MGLIEVASGRLALSELAPGAVQSEIRAMTAECDRIGGVNLAQGVCDTEVPAAVAEGAIKAIRDGLEYLHADGRDCAGGEWRVRAGWVLDPEREVMVASGATLTIDAAAMALLNPGDEVLVFEPFYGYHLTERCGR